MPNWTTPTRRTASGSRGRGVPARDADGGAEGWGRLGGGGRLVRGALAHRSSAADRWRRRGPMRDRLAAAAAARRRRRRRRRRGVTQTTRPRDRPSSSSSYASYMKGLGRSFKGLYSTGGGGSGSTSRDPKNPDPGRPAAARGAGVAGIAPRSAVPGQRDVRVVLAYADDGASDAAVLATGTRRRANARRMPDGARRGSDAKRRGRRRHGSPRVATRRRHRAGDREGERQLEVMSGVMAIHRDECAGKDAELCALRDENASLRELVERLGEPPGSVVRSGVRFPRSPEGEERGRGGRVGGDGDDGDGGGETGRRAGGFARRAREVSFCGVLRGTFTDGKHARGRRVVN